MRSLGTQTFKRHLCHTVLPEYRCLPVSQSITKLHRGLTIFAHMNGSGNRHVEEYVDVTSVTARAFWDIFHFILVILVIFTLRWISLFLYVCVCVCVQPPVVPDRVFFGVRVCHSSYDWMHVVAQSQRNPVMNEPPIFQLLQGQPERKQNRWVTLSQHPANAAPLHHSSSELNSAAMTNKESNYYCRNLYWPSPAILPKGNALIEMFTSEMRGSKKRGFLYSLIAWRASTAPRQSREQLSDSNNGSDEKSVILRHSPMTGRGRHLFELNGAETTLNIISTKGFKSTWWMLISHSISTNPSLH